MCSPFGVRKDARDQVEGKQALGAAAVAVDRERDSLEQEGEVGEFAALLELRRLHAGELLKQLARNAGAATPGAENISS